MTLAIKIILWIPYVFTQVTLMAGIIIMNLAFDIPCNEMSLLVMFVISYSAMVGASIELRHWFKGEKLTELEVSVTNTINEIKEYMKTKYINLKHTWVQKLTVTVVLLSLVAVVALSWYAILYVWTTYVIT